MPADGRQAAAYGHYAAITLRRGQVAVLDARSPAFNLLHLPKGTHPTEAAAVSDETLLVPTGAGFLCFGLSSLEARWQRPGRAICTPIRTAQGYLYATTRNELVHVDKLGQVLWQLLLDGPARGLCEAGPRGVAVAVPGALLVFELDSGALRWQLPASAIAEAPGPSSAGRTIFAIDAHERVAAIDVEIGRWVWQYSVRVPFEGGAIFGARGALCPGPGLLALRDRLGGVILLDSSTGAERWRRPGELTPNPTMPGPISWHDTQLHYVNERGDVLVVEAESNADLDRLIHEPDEYGSPLRRARPETRPYQVGEAWLLVSDSRLELLS